LYSSPNIIRIIKSGMRSAGHVALMGEVRNAYNMLVAELKVRDHLEGMA
jgi:hypothetical protein